MPNLFDEAIADAKALKEMAEANARNKIIESISPKIRQLIEQQMLSEQDEETSEDDAAPNLDLEALPDDMNGPGTTPAMPAPSMGTMGAAPGAPDPDEEVTHTVTTKTASGTEVKINVRVDKHGEASASAESDEAPGDDVDISLNKEGLEALADMVLGERKRDRVSYGTVRRQFESLKRVSKDLPLTERSNFRAAYAILVKNTHDLQSQLLSNGGTPAIKQKFNTLVKEMKQMSTSARFRRLLEEMDSKPRLRREAKLVFDPTDLEGLDDDDFKEKLKGMSFGVEFAGEEGQDAQGTEEMPVDVSGGGAPAPAPAAGGAPAAPVSEDEDRFYEMMDDEDEDEGMDYLDEEDYDDSDDDDDDDSENEGINFNVDESMLRRELSRLREAKGRSSKGKNAKGIKDPMSKAFGGGNVAGLPDELNQLSEADEAEEVASKALEVAKKATDAAKSERAARVEETRKNRDLSTRLSESERANATLREQLEEVNLFNAKLLYVNKLMQNRDLTPRQQRAIVESLDAAKSVREAKLLFTSLTESLKSKSGNVNEGRVMGSSSRSTRPGGVSNLNESVEVDRWGILAGIKSGK